MNSKSLLSHIGISTVALIAGFAVFSGLQTPAPVAEDQVAQVASAGNTTFRLTAVENGKPISAATHKDVYFITKRDGVVVDTSPASASGTYTVSIPFYSGTYTFHAQGSKIIGQNSTQSVTAAPVTVTRQTNKVANVTLDLSAKGQQKETGILIRAKDTSGKLVSGVPVAVQTDLKSVYSVSYSNTKSTDGQGEAYFQMRYDSTTSDRTSRNTYLVTVRPKEGYRVDTSSKSVFLEGGIEVVDVVLTPIPVTSLKVVIFNGPATCSPRVSGVNSFKKITEETTPSYSTYLFEPLKPGKYTVSLNEISCGVNDAKVMPTPKEVTVAEGEKKSVDMIVTDKNPRTGITYTDGVDVLVIEKGDANKNALAAKCQSDIAAYNANRTTNYAASCKAARVSTPTQVKVTSTKADLTAKITPALGTVYGDAANGNLTDGTGVAFGGEGLVKGEKYTATVLKTSLNSAWKAKYETNDPMASFTYTPGMIVAVEVDTSQAAR